MLLRIYISTVNGSLYSSWLSVVIRERVHLRRIIVTANFNILGKRVSVQNLFNKINNSIRFVIIKILFVLYKRWFTSWMIHSLEGPTEQFKIINFLLLLKASNLFHKCSEYSCSAVLNSRENRRSYHTANYYVYHFKN